MNEKLYVMTRKKCLQISWVISCRCSLLCCKEDIYSKHATPPRRSQGGETTSFILTGSITSCSSLSFPRAANCSKRRSARSFLGGSSLRTRSDCQMTSSETSKLLRADAWRSTVPTCVLLTVLQERSCVCCETSIPMPTREIIG